jgi:phosphoribosylglycinamide formyltransferase 1
VTQRIVVLISGGGSNLEALLTALPDSGIPATVVAVGADNDASGLEHARTRDIPTFVVSRSGFPDREQWGRALGDDIARYAPDWIVLSGFMSLLPPGVIERFGPCIINTHPAYLPEFPGAHAVRDAIAAGVGQTGASVIIVDDGVDTGPILARQRVPVNPGDTEELLHERIKVVERALLLDVLETLVSPEEGKAP